MWREALLLAQQGGDGGAAGGGLLGFLPIILIVGIFYLLIYRPMKRRQKSLEKMISELKNGDKVITSGGLYGTVAGLRENTVILKIADQIKVEVAKSAVAGLQSPRDGSGE